MYLSVQYCIFNIYIYIHTHRYISIYILSTGVYAKGQGCKQSYACFVLFLIFIQNVNKRTFFFSKRQKNGSLCAHHTAAENIFICYRIRIIFTVVKR